MNSENLRINVHWSRIELEIGCSTYNLWVLCFLPYTLRALQALTIVAIVATEHKTCFNPYFGWHA